MKKDKQIEWLDHVPDDAIQLFFKTFSNVSGYAFETIIRNPENFQKIVGIPLNYFVAYPVRKKSRLDKYVTKADLEDTSDKRFYDLKYFFWNGDEWQEIAAKDIQARMKQNIERYTKFVRRSTDSRTKKPCYRYVQTPKRFSILTMFREIRYFTKRSPNNFDLTKRPPD